MAFVGDKLLCRETLTQEKFICRFLYITLEQKSKKDIYIIVINKHFAIVLVYWNIDQ